MASTVAGEIMGRFAGTVCAAALIAAACISASVAVCAEHHEKNWVPPATKIYAQQLVDEIMATHPELVSVAFHGAPPGQADTYTMFAGPWPDRIGNADDGYDIDITRKGITILNPRLHLTDDGPRRFVVMLPLRDATGETISAIVIAYKNPSDSRKSEKDFFLAALALRDGLQKKIKDRAALFAPAR
jgi:hypothetical protein